MKCIVCIDSETDECQVISAGVANFVRCVLFVPATEKREQKPAPVNRPPTVLRHCWLVGEVMDIISDNLEIASLIIKKSNEFQQGFQQDLIENPGTIPK